MVFYPFLNKQLLWIIIMGGIFSGCSDQKVDTFEFKYANGDLTILYKKAPVLVYNVEKDLPDSIPGYYARSGYLHPIYSPTGIILTDDFPVDHTHQHGSFFAFVNTTYQDSVIDFWNQHKLTGTVKHKALLDTFYTENGIGFTSTLDHISLIYGKVLDEQWKIEVFEWEGNRVIDFTSTISNPGQDTFFINPYNYGGFAIRGAAQWNVKDTVYYQSHANFLTSESKTLDNANHSEAEWATLYGTIDNQEVGVTIIGHPDNFRYPQKIRIHPVMPYFCYAPMVDSGFYIAPMDVYISRYRIYPFDGKPDPQIAHKLLQEFSEKGD